MILRVGQWVDLWRLEIHTAIHVSFHVKRSLYLILTKAGQLHPKFPIIRFYEGLFNVSSVIICMWTDTEILIEMLMCLKIETQNQKKIHNKIQNNSVCVCVCVSACLCVCVGRGREGGGGRPESM